MPLNNSNFDLSPLSLLPGFGTHALSVETRDGYTLAEIEAAGGIASGIEADVRDHEAVEAIVAGSWRRRVGSVSCREFKRRSWSTHG